MNGKVHPGVPWAAGIRASEGSTARNAFRSSPQALYELPVSQEPLDRLLQSGIN